jgi:CBS domain-containing protein
MPTVADILAVKGQQVHSTTPGATVLSATLKMNQYKLGALIVMQGNDVAGIFTERDVLRRVVAEQRDPATATVAEVMTAGIITVKPETDLDEVSQIMQQKRIRHLPVCDGNGRLHGMISIGDVKAFNVRNQEAHINFLNEYIYGRA